ncbi:carbonic anhydrase [Geomonas terrae]|uniref:hypothetical protein n=1 Tax=Geomonas terrae TaxID=2562681 RepID=UPI0018E0B8C4|nr:hypothetical protein [Geomonas terrae]
MSTITPLSGHIAWHPVAAAAQLPKRSKLLAKEVQEGKIKIVAAKYDIDDGKVTLLK